MKNVEFFNLKTDGHFDHRGWAVNPIPMEKLTKQKFGHIHIVSVAPGAVRGNHYHDKTTEFLFVYGGEYEFYHTDNGSVKNTHFDDSQLVGIKINTGTAHAIKNVDKRTIYVMAYYDLPYDSDNPDTKERKLI